MNTEKIHTLILIFALALSLTLCACGQTTTETPKSAKPTEEAGVYRIDRP